MTLDELANVSPVLAMGDYMLAYLGEHAGDGFASRITDLPTPEYGLVGAPTSLV
jgi:hypothetical protein